MKDFFAVDVFTGSSESDKIVRRTLDKKLEDTQREYTQKMKSYEDKAKMPMILSTVMVVSIIIAFFVTCAFFMNLTQMQDGQRLRLTDWVLLIFGIIFAVVGIFLWQYKNRRVKKIAKSEEYNTFLKDWENLYKRCEQDLKIPKNAKVTDVFLYVYTTKDGKEKPVYKAFNYVNASVKIFAEGDMLMVADQQTVFGFEKKWFTGFEVYPKSITFNNWNKDKPITDDEYRKYGLKATGYGVYTVKNAVKLFIEKDGKKFFILVPPYDSDKFLNIFGKGSKGGKTK